MKKTKILTVLGVLLAMGITACGGKTASKSGSKAADGSSAGGQSTSQPAPSTSKPASHKHVWDEGRVTKDPTCDEPGVRTFTCTGEGTCPQNNTKTEPEPALGHQWGEAQPVAAENGGVSYNKYVCGRPNCGAVKYDIDLTGADRLTFVDGGSLKADSNLPGWVKLASPNGGGFEIQFNSDVYGEGKIYQNGAMDHWTDNTNNTQRGFFSGNSTSSTHADENGNFALLMNGTAVDFSDKKSLTYGDMYPATDADHPAAAEGYSPLAEIETGAVKVGKGLNTIKFTRVDSFNIILKSFVIVFKPADHAEHTFGEWQVSKAPTCEAEGQQYRACSVCGIREVKATAPQHDWDDEHAVTVEEEGYTKYIKTECKTCHKFKYEFPTYVKDASDALQANVTITGSNKNSNPKTPDGYLKLGSNNNSFSVKFNSKKVAVGKLYQEGIFDQWPGNGKKYGYFSVTSGSAPDGNFKVEVNGTAIDLSQYKGGGNDSATYNFYKFSYENDGTQEWEDSYTTSNGVNTVVKWSEDILCPIGDVTLDKDEDVTIKYTRVNSYNLAVKNLVLIVSEYDHTHSPATAWTSDDEGHWHACSDANCPIKGIKFDYEAHTLEADTSGDADTESTCAVHGIAHKKCTICEKKVDVELPLGEHEWEEKQTEPATANSDGKTIIPLECKNCHKAGAKMNVSDYSSYKKTSDGTDQPAIAGPEFKFEGGSTIIYKIKVAKAGQYALRIFGWNKNNQTAAEGLSKAPYSVKVGEGDNAVDAPVSNGTYESLGVGGKGTSAFSVDKAAEFVLVPVMTLAEGENVIQIIQGSGGNRISFCKTLTVLEN